MAPTSAPFPKLPLRVLWLVFALYALPGLIDHDPWRGDDAEFFSAIHQMLGGGDWLIPSVAGRPLLDYPPLYYWLGAILGKAFGWLIPLHDAARLASGLFVAATLYCLARAARKLYGEHADRAAVLLGLGTLGLLIHAHEFQPQLALLACSSAAFLGYAEFLAAPRRGAIIAGLAIGAAFLAAGLAALPLLLPLWVLLPGLCSECRKQNRLKALGLGAAITAVIVLGWIGLLASLRPANFSAWWSFELASITPHFHNFIQLDPLLQLMAWFLWPLWPLAGWTLWKRRKQLTETSFLLPLASFALALILVCFTGALRPAHALPLIPPLLLLAADGALSLRRGAASSLDWFGRMTFATTGAFAWIAWSAQHFGHPAPLARNIARLVPGYVPQLSTIGIVCAVALSLAWIAVMIRPPRSPLRGAFTWAAGVTFLWALVVALFLAPIDASKSYRRISQELALALAQHGSGCVAEIGMGPSQWGSFAYFDKIAFVSARPGAPLPACTRLVIYTSRDETVAPPASWRPVWEMSRGRKRSAERLRLYVPETL
ncbi:ArnT family glycosyltransferase [Niveibacterium terrae]|uniref:ArnT family glycosyltransferase n=1 Tax=Niveibacterium terrae TaxID=3373598 RepID=UPI003A930746